MFKPEKLRGKMAEQKMNAEYISYKLGINTATFYRKLNGNSEFNRQEMNAIKTLLNLNKDEMDNIFFA